MDCILPHLSPQRNARIELFGCDAVAEVVTEAVAEEVARARMGDPAGAPQASLVLAADDPERLAQFYGALLEQPPQPGLSASHWRVALPGGGCLELYAPSRQRPQPRQVGRLAVCAQRRGPATLLETWLAQAQALGAELREAPRSEPFGSEAWLLDPEGNPLLLLVTP